MKTSNTQFDLDSAKRDIQQLLKATSRVADEAVIDARDRLGSALKQAGHRAESAGKFVRSHAYETAVIALIAGLAAGYALSRSNGK